MRKAGKKSFDRLIRKYDRYKQRFDTIKNNYDNLGTNKNTIKTKVKNVNKSLKKNNTSIVPKRPERVQSLPNSLNSSKNYCLSHIGIGSAFYETLKYSTQEDIDSINQLRNQYPPRKESLDYNPPRKDSLNYNRPSDSVGTITNSSINLTVSDNKDYPTLTDNPQPINKTDRILDSLSQMEVNGEKEVNRESSASYDSAQKKQLWFRDIWRERKKQINNGLGTYGGKEKKQIKFK